MMTMTTAGRGRSKRKQGVKRPLTCNYKSEYEEKLGCNGSLREV